MELEQLQALASNIEDLKKAIEAEKPQVDQDRADLVKLYDILEHEVMSKTKRPDKTAKTDQGDKIVELTRIALSLQKLIVRRHAMFLAGYPIQVEATPGDDLEQDMITVIKKALHDNKLVYEDRSLVRSLLRGLEIAELWYTEPVDDLYWKGTPNEGAKFRNRVRILSPVLGDSLFPSFNVAGDLVAFGRGYQLEVNGKKIDCFDVYFADKILKGTKGESGWEVLTEINIIGKIPIIYNPSIEPIYGDAQSAINRKEKLASNHGDSNDYYAFPMMAIYGNIEGFADKGEQGKVLQLVDGARAEMLAAPQAPETLKLEFENLRSWIFDLTDTPDISFEQMKNIGGQLTNFGVEMMFLAAHMRAAENEEIFGKYIQRRYNYLKAANAKINVKLEAAVQLEVKPRFEYFLPKNNAEKITMLSEAKTSGILSTKTAVTRNPLVDNVEEELKNLDDEASSAGALDNELL